MSARQIAVMKDGISALAHHERLAHGLQLKKFAGTQILILSKEASTLDLV